jgi:hypothetical protein
LKQRLQERLGMASGALLNGGRISWRQAKDSQDTDYKKLAAEHPDLVAKFAITKPGSRRFLAQVGK